MTCPHCQRRAALVAALVPAISRLSFSRRGLLRLLSLPNEQLLRAAKVEDPLGLLRRLEIAAPTESVPSALCRHDAGYPEALAQLSCAPAVLYGTCTIERLHELLAKPIVAIVGGSVNTDYAQQITLEITRDLATAGVTVVSGLNDGLEETAHHGALEADGENIVVMPGSPEIAYPRRLQQLHQRIRARGAAVSEFPPGFWPPERWCFIAIQRIIAALASIVVVVEAGGRSASLFAAQIAADLGGDVAVVPGRVTDSGGHWIFALLRDGAHPVECAQNVLELLHGTGAHWPREHISSPASFNLIRGSQVKRPQPKAAPR